MNMIKKSITVTETQNDWIKSQLQSGHYASDSELLRDLIRKEQARNNEIQAIRQALLESEESGLSNKTPQEILNDFKRQRSLNV